ncbi:MAG TPA: hypothetical protein VFL47_14450, partial [Flavisolibacter sp.]|nr:hypothetical protein [Flavisolibacter sp.]
RKSMKAKLFILSLLGFGLSSQAQYSELQKNPFHKAYHDSLRAMNYPYTFPLLAKKAYKKGFDIPYPWGIGTNYFWAKQEVTISNISVGVNGKDPVDLTNVIQFGKITAEANAYTIRPDLFVFPFLSVYGVFGFGNSNIDVPVVKPVVFTTHPTSKATSAGLGFTVAGGFQGMVLIFDNSFNWLNTDKLTDLVPAYNATLRFAYQFNSSMRTDRTITVWMGPCFQKIKADTKGEIAINEIFPGLDESQKQNIKDRLDEWYNSLTPPQQAVAGQIIDKIKEHFAGRDPGNGKITYQLDKKIAGPWNLVFGSQFQFNKHWMMRIEMGAYGQRSQFLLSFNYRFESLKHKSNQP